MTTPRTPPTALVTGASAGIGQQLACLFAADGYHLILVARRRNRLEQLAAELERQFRIKALVIDADLSQPDSASRIVNELERLDVAVDVLVNNAGFGKLGAFAELDATLALEMIAVNIAALVHLTRLLLPSMLARQHGKILNIGSLAGFLPGPNMAVYYATKAFVNSFSEALAEEVRGSGVSVTACCPGPTATEFGAVAGSADRPLIKAHTQSAAFVAKTAYRALQQGQVLAIPGLTHRWLARLLRLAPRAIVRRLAGRANQLAKS